MKSIIILSILFTACGMQKTDQAIADKIAAVQVPTAEKADPSIDADARVLKVEAPEIVETKKSIDEETLAPAGVTEQPIEVQKPEKKLLKVRICETYNRPNADFKMVTEFYDDHSRKNIISLSSTGTGNTIYIPETVIEQRFNGDEDVTEYADILIPMDYRIISSFGLSGQGNLWRIEQRIQDISEPVVYYGAKAGLTGTTVLGSALNLGGNFSCRIN